LWKGLLGKLVPLLEQKVASDSGIEGATHRVRVGLYTFDADTTFAARPPPGRKTRKLQ
jgi:hypothetical protein